MPKEIFLVSDLHQGGDGQLQQCDYTEEFIRFLRDLQQRGPDIELIIMGDTFGLWEYTEVQGIQRLVNIIKHHQAIYDEIKRLGEKATVTMMVGNHDYDMACDPQYAEILRRYNIHLDTALSLQRQFAGHTVWLEHGQQADIFNASPDYGNRYALPIGYFITETAVAGASRFSVFGRGNWLKDIRSVGTMQIPEWILSNYFYREMSGPLRWFIVPFTLFLGIGFLALIAQVLVWLGIAPTNVVVNNPFFERLGFVGNILQLIIVIDLLLLFIMLIAAVPLYIVLNDLRRTLERFQVLGSGEANLDIDGNGPYEARARTVFREHGDAAVYVFGHTHAAYLKEENGRLILNTGSWLKLLERVGVRFGRLPGVYVARFRCNYWRIAEENGDMVVEYVEVPKVGEKELTLLQRMLLAGKKPRPLPAIPARTVIPGASKQPLPRFPDDLKTLADAEPDQGPIKAYGG